MDKDSADTRRKVMEANYEAALDNVRALRATLQDRRALRHHLGGRQPAFHVRLLHADPGALRLVAQEGGREVGSLD
ncbi:MAG: hypothetical protein ACMG5Z_05845, partial [Luteimonas sp.]